MDFDIALDRAMVKLNKQDKKFRRHVSKTTAKPKKIRRDMFIKNLERIDKSLKRRKISTNEAILQLQKLIN